MKEPILTTEDIKKWDAWKRRCLVWSRTSVHSRRISQSCETIYRMHGMRPGAYVAYSGGKDSTVMLHLIHNTLGACLAFSVKDDMDYPGEIEYVGNFAASLGVSLEILVPDFSLKQWLRDNASRFNVDDDFHSRAAELSDKAFYSIIEEHRIKTGNPGVYIGLRKHESKGRMLNRCKRGTVYEKSDGNIICQPIADWEGQDVYAYAFTHFIDLLPIYRCVRLHESPERIRKSWWLPGRAATNGGLFWLKTYYPSMYLELARWFSDARAKT